MYFSFLFLIVICLTSEPISGQNQLKKNLVIVLDVTASMSDEIDILRENVKKLLDNVNAWSRYSFGDYMLILFDDEEVNNETVEPFVSPKYTNLKEFVNNVTVNKRNRDAKCTASCYSALKRGLDLVNENSVFLVFTNGGSTHLELLPEIKNLTVHKRISYYFTLTKGCIKANPTDDYRDLVSTYNGDIYNVDHSNFEKHFELLAQIITGPPFAPSVDVFIDSTISEFTITVTGRNSIITIFDPNKKYVSSLKQRVLTNLPNIKMINVPVPIPGRYTIEIVSESSYTAQVQTTSDLQFKYGFSIYEPSSIGQTNYAPLIGYKTYLSIFPSNVKLIDELDNVTLTTSKTSEQVYKLHRSSSRGGDFFLTDPIEAPSDSFKIYVSGRDRLNYRISRLISPIVYAITPERPNVKTDKRISVQEGDPINLTCRAQSMTNVTVKWFKLSLDTPLKMMDFPQSDTLNYTIDSSRPSDSDVYVCLAENSVGSHDSKSTVMVKETRLFVHTPINAISVDVDTEQVVLECNVTPNTKYVKVSWLFNGKPYGFENTRPKLVLFNIQRNFSGYYTCVGQKGAQEKRSTIQLTVNYPPNILDLFNSNTNTSIDNTKPLTIINNTRLEIICNYEGVPTSTVQWISPSGEIVSKTSELYFDKAHVPGEYKCQVKNDMGSAERNVDIDIISQQQTSTEISRLTSTITPVDVSVAPSITEFQVIDDEGTASFEAREQEIGVVNQTNILVVCKTNGIPIPSTKWIKDEIIVSTTNNLTISVIESNFSALYECVTENELNTSRIAIKIKKITKPMVISDYNKSVELIEGVSFSLRCPIKTGERNVTWFQDGKNIDQFKLSDGSIYIDSVTVAMNGLVVCIASNKAGTANATFIFDVLRAPHDLIVTTAKGKVPILNEPFEMECGASGRPEPTLYWTKDDIYFRQGALIQFNRFKDRDYGKYSCIAGNDLGIVNETFTLRHSIGTKTLTSIYPPTKPTLFTKSPASHFGPTIILLFVVFDAYVKSVTPLKMNL